MKVLHIITDLTTGGAEVMLHKLLSATDRKRIQSVVVSLKSKATLGGPMEALGVPVYELGMEKTIFKGLSGFFRFMVLARKIRPDLIQGWMAHGNFMASLGGFFLKNSVPVVWNIRQAVYDLSFESRSTAFLIKLCARFSNGPARIIYNSETSARQHEALHYNSDKTVVIANGFDMERFSPSPEARATLRRELNLKPDAFLIGLVARFHPMKDHDNFIRAAAIFSKSEHEACFILSGKGVDAGNAHLMNLIKSHHLDKYFHLLGDRGNLPQIMAGLDIATSSSYTESFPNVVGEAMACGVPCAVTDVGDSANIVADTGKIVPPRNPAALAQAWQEFIKMNRDARSELGLKARERIEKCYNLNDITHGYEDLYQKLFNSKNQPDTSLNP